MQPVQAYDVTYYSSNDILFFSPTGGDVCSSDDGGVVGVALNGKDNIEKIFNYMTDKGLSDEQAAGVVGNISHESGGDPENTQTGFTPDRTKDPTTVSVNSEGAQGGWGIIQWTPSSKVVGIAKDMGITGPIYELSTQLDILYGHMTGTSPTGVQNMLEQFKNINDVTEATYYFEEKVEGAGKPLMEDRVAAAILALEEFGGKASTSPAVSTTLEAVCGDDMEPGAEAGNAVQTAINYSWPEYHSKPYVQMKPSYAMAVEAAKANGEYIGGIDFPGVDCGGFVTRVMRNSMADPEYNNKEGNTAYQEDYLASSGKYEEIKPTSTADMRPGDIAIRGSDHTYMYVGKQTGFQTEIASASLDGRAPMAGSEAPADPEYRWFRLK